MAKRDLRSRKRKTRKKKTGSTHHDLVSRKPAETDVIQNTGRAMALAVELHRAGKLPEARQLYRQVLKVQPDHSDALSSLAMVDAALHPARALGLLEKAIAINDGDPGYHMNHGYLLDRIGRTDEAISAYTKAIYIMPSYRDPYYNLGDLYLKQGKPGSAIDVFDRCIRENGRDFLALAYKAHALRDAGDQASADLLLNHDLFVKEYEIPVPGAYEGLTQLNQVLAKHVKTHPSLQSNVRSTENGDHTGELLRDPEGPMIEVESLLNDAVSWYSAQLADIPDHPFVECRPKAWRLTAWGVVLKNQGHERPHIHPNGWLSGVFYVQLPDILSDSGSAPQGWLEFGRPTADLHVKSEPDIRLHKPAYGSIIMFPSYFYHRTIPFNSREKRICIAFDAEPVVGASGLTD